MIPIKKCDSCNKGLPLGSSKYNVRIEITSDFDGFLADEDDEGESDDMESLLEEIEEFSEEELEADVHLEVELTLCRECKNRLVELMEDYTDTGMSTRPKRSPSLH